MPVTVEIDPQVLEQMQSGPHAHDRRLFLEQIEKRCPELRGYALGLARASMDRLTYSDAPALERTQLEDGRSNAASEDYPHWLAR